MRFLTDFADQAVIIPVVLAVAAVLAVQGWQRGALAWLVVIAGTFGAMLALKLTFLACTPVFAPLDIQSPSGHVAAATVVAGGLAGLLSRRHITMLSAAVLAAVVIGLTRLWLNMHSLPEVMVGASIGLIGAACLPRLAGYPPRMRLAPLVVAAVLTGVVFHGLHLPAEAAIRHTAYRAAQFIPACRQDAATFTPDRPRRMAPWWLDQLRP